MRRVLAGARQHGLLSLLEPRAANNALLRGFGTSGWKVSHGRTSCTTPRDTISG